MKALLFLTLILFISPIVQASPSDSHLPYPPYPKEALERKIEGTVLVSVKFDSEGSVDSCEVIKSSGSELLDDLTVEFIERHWKSPLLAGKKDQVPITYKLAPPHPNQKSTTHEKFDQALLREGFHCIKLIGALNANLIKVEMNGHPFTLYVDTGASYTFISKKAAHAAGFETKDTKVQTNGINGHVKGTVEWIKVNSFKIGGIEMPTPPVYALDFNKNQFSVNFDGILGLDTLKRNHAVYVVNPALLFLNARQPAEIDDCLKSSGCFILPLSYHHYKYHIPVKLDGFNLQMVFDTGAGFSLINERIVKANQFRIEDVSIPTKGIDQHEFSAQAVSFKEVYLGDFPFGHLMMTTATPAMFSTKWNAEEEENNAGLLGFDVLGNILTIIDTSADTMYLHHLAK